MSISFSPLSFGPSVFGFTLNLFNPGRPPLSEKKRLEDFIRLSPGFADDFDKPHIFDMLSWQSRLSDFVGRKEEFASLRRWAKSKKPVSVLFVTGDGGTGKSRLAGELALELKKNDGWEAGFLGIDELGEIPLGKTGTLIIIDYPEKDPDKIKTAFEALSKVRGNKSAIRVLLLTRSPLSEWERTLTTTGVHGCLEEDLRIHLERFEPTERHVYEICHSASERASHIFQTSQVTNISYQFFTQEDVTRWLKDNPGQYSRPLFLVAAGIHAARFPEERAMTLSALEMIDALVLRENKRIWKTSESLGAEEDALSRILLMATVADTLSWDKIRNAGKTLRTMLGIPENWDAKRHLTESGWLRDGVFTSIQPDIVGAGFVAEVLQDNPGNGAALLLEAILLSEGDRWRENFWRLGKDMKLVLEKDATPAALLGNHITNMSERFDKLDDLAFTEEWHGIAPLCVAVCENRLRYEELEPAMKGTILNNLSEYHSGLGNRHRALEAIEKAVQEYEKLADENPARFLPNLAGSLNNASNQYAGNGDTKSALLAIEKAVQIREKLADENPARFLPDLAGSLNNASNRYAENGDTKNALLAIEKAVQVYEKLVDENPARFLPDLAASLNNASIRYAKNGDTKNALLAIEKAVQIKEKLADENPARFLPDLASSLNNASNRYAENGDTKKALLAIEEAVQIREKLADENPARFLPDLAGSLNNASNRYAENGDTKKALLAIEEAVQIRKKLADENPARFLPDLAGSLNNASNLYAENGDTKKALLAIEAAVQEYEKLADENPARFLPDLAGSLNNASGCYAENGDTKKALLAIEKAVHITENLTKEFPARFEPDLAVSLCTRGEVFMLLDERHQAIENFQRALSLLKPFAKQAPNGLNAQRYTTIETFLESARDSK